MPGVIRGAIGCGTGAGTPATCCCGRGFCGGSGFGAANKEKDFCAVI